MAGLNLVALGDAEVAQFRTLATGDSSDKVTITYDPSTGSLDAELLDANGNRIQDSGIDTTGNITLSLANLPILHSGKLLLIGHSVLFRVVSPRCSAGIY